ncbi:aldehyde dehydrogenase [Acetobacter malorum]|uniref:Aldehyde dehydrogenase n=1 Tax=Acetobacter malorum TaxID=178901 RepID=A0A149V0R0_9PROT|nr:cupin domain-containing protein [Acetobacter malorum]KXV73850.1 aldehyde dehydrogenase [Acetobacter malorum]
MDVGGTLYALRTQRGLSQRELARRCGVANGTISLIESNAINPSVGLLHQIVHALPMNLSEFFAFEHLEERKLFYRASELREIGGKGISYRQIGTNLNGRALQMLDEVYAPRTDTGKTMLHHTGEEGGVVISGEIEVTVADQRAILGPGDAYYFDSNLPHRFRNIGKEPCHIVSAATPPSF